MNALIWIPVLAVLGFAAWLFEQTVGRWIDRDPDDDWTDA